MEYFFLTLIFLFGTALGSFISVIANRYNTGLPFFKGRSVCFSCNTQLQKMDLVPIFSFLFLDGRCRYCKSKIPNDVFFTEITTGLLLVLVAFKLGIFDNFQFSIFNFQSIFQFSIITAIFATILLISVYDLKHFIIPDSFLIFLFVFSFFYVWLLATSYWLLVNLISGIVLAIPFLLIFLISKGRWLGFGDVKYIAVIGFWLGLAQGLSAVILAFWIGAVFSLSAILIKKIIPFIDLPLLKNNLTIKSEIPFGPFLSLGAIISFCLSLDLFQIHDLFNFF